MKLATYLFEPFLKPEQADNYHQNIDKSKVRDDWDKVDEELLVKLHVLNIDSKNNIHVRPCS